MASRYYTLIIVPEKTAPLKKIIIPAWILRGAAVGFIFLVLLAGMMLLDYWYVMSQISENKQLKIDNRKLKQQVQVFQNKMSNVESTMERIKTFATRLKVITNIEDRSSLLQSLNQKLPDASTNLGQPEKKAFAQESSSSPENTNSTSPSDTAQTSAFNPQWREDPEEVAIKKEYEALDGRISALNEETLYVEQILQDQYELLADQKAFLSALPTRKPTVGYFTSGFGVRKAPIGGREKMHEGVDIANHLGTVIRTPADGIVTFSSTKPGYGLVVIVDHGYGLETLYAHSRKLLVQTGQKIKRGDPIAQLGNTGRSTGPHLHYEVRVNGIPVDPLDYILEN